MRIQKDMMVAALQGGYENFEGVAMAATILLTCEILYQVHTNIYNDGKGTDYITFADEEIATEFRKKNSGMKFEALIIVNDKVLAYNGRRYDYQVRNSTLYIFGL